MDRETMRQQLIERVRENYADYRADLLLKERQELIDGADRIAKTAEVFQYFTEHRLTEPETAYFLQFQNPLEVAADHWSDCEFELDALQALIADVADKADDLTLYPLAADAPVEKPSGLQKFMNVDLETVFPQIMAQKTAFYQKDLTADAKARMKKQQVRRSAQDAAQPAATGEQRPSRLMDDSGGRLHFEGAVDDTTAVPDVEQSEEAKQAAKKRLVMDHAAHAARSENDQQVDATSPVDSETEPSSEIDDKTDARPRDSPKPEPKAPELSGVPDDREVYKKRQAAKFTTHSAAPVSSERRRLQFEDFRLDEASRRGCKEI